MPEPPVKVAPPRPIRRHRPGPGEVSAEPQDQSAVYAVIRTVQSRFGGGDMRALLRQVKTLDEARAVARVSAREFGPLVIERWEARGKDRFAEHVVEVVEDTKP